MIMKYDRVFMVCTPPCYYVMCYAHLSPTMSCVMLTCPLLQDDDKAWANQVKEEAIQRRGKPQKPLPYSVHLENVNMKDVSMSVW